MKMTNTLDETNVNSIQPAFANNYDGLRQACQMLETFVGKQELTTLRENFSGEDGAYFIGVALELANRIHAMPTTSERAEADAAPPVAYLRYSNCNAEWYVVKRSPALGEIQHEAYGFARPYGDGGETSMSNISIEKLLKLGVDLDIYFTPQPLDDIRSKPEAPPCP